MARIISVAVCTAFLLALGGFVPIDASASSHETKAGAAVADAHDGEHAECACKGGTEGKTFWCEKCGAGYVDGEKVKCKGCYDAKTGGEPCAACAKKKSETN